MRLPEQIPKELRDVAVFLPELEDGEGAWFKDQALAVIESLRGTTVAVSDVFLFERVSFGHGPSETLWSPSETVWSVHRLQGEADVDYARRSRLEAGDYLRRTEVGDVEVLFALRFPMLKDAA